MDPETPLYVGSNTENGRIKKQPKQALPKPTGRGRIDVYVNGVFLRQMPVGVLCRFSRVAATAFPKPKLVMPSQTTLRSTREASDGDVNGVGAEGGNEVGDRSNTAADQSTTGPTGRAEDATNVQKVTSENVELNANNTLMTNATTTPQNRLLNLYLETLWLQPPASAFDFAFDWMHLAKKTRPGETPLEYGVPHPENLSLQKLVDIYAASLVLELRPVGRMHRNHVLGRISTQEPTLAALTYLHEHLPIDDIGITRFVNVFFDHRNVRGSTTVAAELAAIENYVCTVDEALYGRFKEIGDDRQRKQRRHHQDRMQRIAEGRQNVDAHTRAGTLVDASSPEQGQGRNVVTGGGGNNSGHETRRGGRRRRQVGYVPRCNAEQ